MSIPADVYIPKVYWDPLRVIVSSGVNTKSRANNRKPMKELLWFVFVNMDSDASKLLIYRAE